MDEGEKLNALMGSLQKLSEEEGGQTAHEIVTRAIETYGQDNPEFDAKKFARVINGIINQYTERGIAGRKLRSALEENPKSLERRIHLALTESFGLSEADAHIFTSTVIEYIHQLNAGSDPRKFN